MAKTINCSNPICGEIISVPEGSIQVICPACNTWHFPEPDESQPAPTYRESTPRPAYPVYDSPPDPTPQEVDRAPNVHQPDNPPVWPSETPAPPVNNPPTEQPAQPFPGSIPQRNEFIPEERYDQIQHQQQKQQPASVNEKIAYLLTETGERMSLKEGRNVIGRKNADLIIDNRTISRRHCVIEASKTEFGGWDYALYDIGHIENAQSTNGVFITGRTQRLANYERLRIVNGTTIKIGTVNLTLQND